MSAVIPNSANVNSVAFSRHTENVEVPVIQTRPPNGRDLAFPIGKRWVDTLHNEVYSLQSVSYSNLVPTANWGILSGAPIAIVNAGLSPPLNGANTEVTASNATVISLVYVAPNILNGSIAPISVNDVNVGNFNIFSDNASNTSTIYYIVVN